MFKVYKKLLKYVPKKRYLAYMAIIMTTISSIITVASYYYVYLFLESAVVQGDTGGAKYYAMLIIGMLVGGYLLYMAAVMLTHILGFRLETNLRKIGIDGLSKASFRFYDLNPSGKVRKIIDDNAGMTHVIVAHMIPDNAGAVVTPILAVVVGFMVSIKLGVALLIITAFGATLLKFMSGGQEFMTLYQKALERLSGETVEYVRGMQVIKIFGATVTSFKALHDAINDYSQQALNYSMSCRKPFVWFQLLFAGLVAFFVPLAVLFLDLDKEPGVLAVEFVMALFLSGVLFISSMKVMRVSMNAFQGIVAVDNLENIYEEMQKDGLTFGDKEKFESFDIEFDNVSFAYEDNRVIENFSLKLEESKSYALVGASGSGKSTIAKLISGFYKVDEGAIKLGGFKLESYTEEAVMKNISFVFQDAKLFKMSIYENVRVAKPEAGREEIMEALHLAGCQEMLAKLKDGVETVIGTKGVFLSGGEKQRIAIARAILKDAKIIILDEASAAVDPENEHELQKAFANLMKGKTVIMIAHRLSSIRNVDEIFVMEAGTIVERGSDEALMAQDSKYKELQKLYGKANQWRVRYEKAV